MSIEVINKRPKVVFGRLFCVFVMVRQESKLATRIINAPNQVLYNSLEYDPLHRKYRHQL